LRKNKQFFKTTTKVQILNKLSVRQLLSLVGFFSRDDLMQIDKIQRMKRGQYKPWMRLVSSAQFDRN
jgi:hypothetical protein